MNLICNIIRCYGGVLWVCNIMKRIFKKNKLPNQILQQNCEAWKPIFWRLILLRYTSKQQRAILKGNKVANYCAKYWIRTIKKLSRYILLLFLFIYRRWIYISDSINKYRNKNRNFCNDLNYKSKWCCPMRFVLSIVVNRSPTVSSVHMFALLRPIVTYYIYCCMA